MYFGSSFSSFCVCKPTFPWGEMRRILSFLLVGLVWILSACDGVPDDYRLPPQEFAKVLELNGRDAGSMYGRVLFPSAYTQRSVRFSLGGRRFVTQPDGRFLIERIPAGAHTLNIQVKNYEPIVHQLAIAGDGAVEAGPWRLKMARGRVLGRLVGDDGKSAMDVAIRLSPLGDLTKTDGDGIFQFIGVNSGDHTLAVTDPQYFTYNRDFSLSIGEERNLGNIKVFRKAGFALPRAAVMKKRNVISPVSREFTE